MVLACPVTFVLGLNFLEDWLHSLIDLADQSGDMVKGTDSSYSSTALVSMLTDSMRHGSQRERSRQWVFSRVFLHQGCASLVLSE